MKYFWILLSIVAFMVTLFLAHQRDIQNNIQQCRIEAIKAGKLSASEIQGICK